MKNAGIIIISLFLGGHSFAEMSHLDLNRGTVLKCGGQVGEINSLGFKAKISTQRMSDGALELTIASELAQCLKNSTGGKSWSALVKPEARNAYGKIELSRLKLLVSTEDGELISATDLKLTDLQIIKISPAMVRKIEGRKIDIGATGIKNVIVNGVSADYGPIYFGSYLTSNY